MDIVEAILKELGVRYTHTFVARVFTNAPDSDNMYGIKRALSRYGIETVGMHFDDKEEAGISFPCILHLGNSFVVGIDLTGDSIKYYDGKEYKTEDVSQFIKKWTGNSLLVTDTQNAGEPDLFKNRIADIYDTLIRHFLLIVFIGLGVLTIWQDGILNPISVNVLLDIIGVVTCFLLFQKQIFNHDSLADKVCSVLQKGGCDSILKSEEAKFLGLVSWTEIGLAYFSSRILCLSFSGQCLPLLQMIGWVAMTYGIWSIWYQAFKAKHWCTLCITVQIIVWATGIYNMFVFQEFRLSIAAAIAYAACYASALLFTHVISELHTVKGKYTNATKEFLSFKLHDHILKASLHNSNEIVVKENDSSVFYGNTSAKITLSVLTNPHCSPCASMHTKLMRLVTENSNIKVQYIYSSFSKELDRSSLFMIAVYQQKPYYEAVKILEEWYDHGRMSAETFIKEHNLDLQERRVLDEYAKHTDWKEKTGIQATPTIIYSGHELPPKYNVEDLIYLDI